MIQLEMLYKNNYRVAILIKLEISPADMTYNLYVGHN